MLKGRYSIGIDLGTSNTSLSFIDSLEKRPKSRVLELSQLSNLNSVLKKKYIPSSFYFLTKSELLEVESSFVREIKSKNVHGVIGDISLNKMKDSPERVIQSAKSWLCNENVDRRGAILPWGSKLIELDKKLSPVEVSASYLRYLKDKWNQTLAKEEGSSFNEQNITITVPASFDEVSQSLTLEAASLAGYPDDVRLLEEPQAAFYFWLENNSLNLNWEEVTKSKNPLVLVCDIGGGTSDFSLFNISLASKKPIITRIAVSEHLLLGGDNIDLAMAHMVESRIENRNLTHFEMSSLLHQCKLIKENILNSINDLDPPSSYNVSILSDSSSMFSSSITSSIKREEIENLVLDAFFPFTERGSSPKKNKLGLREWGLNFEEDYAITRHLSKFLGDREVSAVLFTGGTISSDFIQKRLLDIISSWQGFSPIKLENKDFLLSVSRGASYSGVLDSSSFKKIKGGYSRSVYLEVEGKKKEQHSKELICILPKGTEEGQSFKLEALRFLLKVDTVVRFNLFYSNYRENDKVGDILEFNEREFKNLSPIETSLTYSERKGKLLSSEVKVQLETELNELGVLKIYCNLVEEDKKSKRWKLDFNLREVKESKEDSYNIDIGVSSLEFVEATKCIKSVFGKKKDKDLLKIKPKALIKSLEKALFLGRNDWNIDLLRSLWKELSIGMTLRGRSLQHEVVWLYLAGFLLRPGYGSSLDGWRIRELWRVFDMGLNFPKEKSSRMNWYIMWRRVSGGLSPKAQLELFKKVEKDFRKKEETPSELIRLIGSLERLEVESKELISKSFIKKFLDKKTKNKNDYIWALGRIWGRVLMYGESNFIMPPDRVKTHLNRILDLKKLKTPINPYILSLLIQTLRVNGDRSLDFEESFRLDFFNKLKKLGVKKEEINSIIHFIPPETSYKRKQFGESLPIGIKLA